MSPVKIWLDTTLAESLYLNWYRSNSRPISLYMTMSNVALK